MPLEVLATTVRSSEKSGSKEDAEGKEKGEVAATVAVAAAAVVFFAAAVAAGATAAAAAAAAAAAEATPGALEIPRRALLAFEVTLTA